MTALSWQGVLGRMVGQVAQKLCGFGVDQVEVAGLMSWDLGSSGRAVGATWVTKVMAAELGQGQCCSGCLTQLTGTSCLRACQEMEHSQRIPHGHPAVHPYQVPHVPGLTLGELLHWRSQAGVAVEGAAPRELLLCSGTHRALGSFAATQHFYSQAVLVIPQILQVCAGPIP